jgi:uncharacterized membrane protein
MLGKSHHASHPEKRMSTTPVSNKPEAPENMPFVAPSRTLDAAAPLRWLRLGWSDMMRTPRLSLTYGFALMLMSVAIAAFTWLWGQMALYIGLATGFVFVGPILALGLYSISRQLAAGLDPVLGYCVREGWSRVQDLMVIGLVLLVVLLVWARAAAMVYVFMPIESEGSWRQLLPFLGVGSTVGALFAAIVFATCAFSLPMILDRRVDGISAIVTSVNAVLRNKGPMLVWAGLIGLSVVVGFATAFLGFVVLLPVIGHATWHAYRETIDASAWPTHEATAAA